MTATRPTMAQRKALERMATGDIVFHMSGLHTAQFWRGATTDRAPSYPTMLALERAAFVERIKQDWRGWQWRITDLGRAALSARGIP